MRSRAGMWPPRVTLAANRSAKTLTPVAARRRSAAARPGAWSAEPLSSSPTAWPERSAPAASRTRSLAGRGRPGRGAGQPGSPASLQEKSAGTIRLATFPGGPRAAATAAEAASPIPVARSSVRTQPDTGRAKASVSAVRGASWPRCCVECSPTMFTTGERALRALCRFASAFPRPGPRCSRVAAGFPVMRAYPSAAPEQTPSNRPRTPRMRGTRSSAETNCISLVPGFIRHRSTSLASRVLRRHSAPIMSGSFHQSTRRRPSARGQAQPYRALRPAAGGQGDGCCRSVFTTVRLTKIPPRGKARRQCHQRLTASAGPAIVNRRMAIKKQSVPEPLCCPEVAPVAQADLLRLEGPEADEELARLAKALGHPARVRILRMLSRREARVCSQIIGELPLAQSTVSEHLRILKDAGLIRGNQDGTRVGYCIDNNALRRLRALTALI